MFDARIRLSFFACLKDAAGKALKNAAQAPGSDQQKNRLRLRPKSGGCRRLRLRNTVNLFSGIIELKLKLEPGQSDGSETLAN